ncbi:MAG TPA: response regulator [Gemmatimonadales bacterium]|nr:response regulator [Gemmatimonadales bacterium]
MSPATILLVDDDPLVRRTLARALERNGHRVASAENGLDGARRAREGGVDLAIVDIHMPDMDGLELLAQLRATLPAMPVIMMSGGDQTRDLALLQDAKLLGACAVLAKPFSLDELYTVIATALASRVPRTG